MEVNPEIDHYLAEGCGRCPLGGTPDCKVHLWQPELKMLRSIVLACGLEEVLKWSVPCYTYQNSNVVIVSAFKDYCSLSFFKGSLLQDTHHLLVSPGESSQAVRLIKFTSVQQIIDDEDKLRAYLYEAIEVEKMGLKVQFKKNPEPMPIELQETLDSNQSLKEAFAELTPGRQRGYILHISQPKQSKTRIARIEKCMPRIFEGKGLNDR